MSSEFAPKGTQSTRRRMMDLPPIGIPIPLIGRRILDDIDMARLYTRAAEDTREDYKRGRNHLPDPIPETRMWRLPLPGIPLLGRRVLSDSDTARLAVRAATDTLRDLAEERKRTRMRYKPFSGRGDLFIRPKKG